jgi:hypothetical protein
MYYNINDILAVATHGHDPVTSNSMVDTECARGPSPGPR